MRNLQYILAVMLAAVLCSSCIRQEPLNAECDITSVTLSGDILNRAPQIGNNTILLVLKDNVSAEALAPEFTLTPGAAIDPPSGTIRDFSEPQEYTVTSQDKKWHKTYTVTVQTNIYVSLAYDFESVNIIEARQGKAHYDEFYQKGENGENTVTWASANSAFVLTLQGTEPDQFPTYQGDNGVKGKCAVLVTRSTGRFGSAAGKPIAAGNLFFGTFDGTNAMTNPLGATHFGIPFVNIPTYFSGYYKFRPGDVFQEYNSNHQFTEVPGKTDIFNLYAVMYEVTADMPYLDGSNVLSLSNPNIICTAEIPDRHASEEWVPFKVPFLYRSGKSIDKDKLAAGLYNLAIVASSSMDGDRFAGAVGSTLMIDELLLTCSTED